MSAEDRRVKAKALLDLSDHYLDISRVKLDDAEFWVIVGNEDKAKAVLMEARAATHTADTLIKDADALRELGFE